MNSKQATEKEKSIFMQMYILLSPKSFEMAAPKSCSSSFACFKTVVLLLLRLFVSDTLEVATEGVTHKEALCLRNWIVGSLGGLTTR